MIPSNRFPTPKFNLGDCVKLPSSPQKMTITWICKHPDFGKQTNRYTGFMECSWFDGLQLQKELFHQDAVQKCDEHSKEHEEETPILLKTVSLTKSI
jgi:uncharacterized protein YodC (DUF2158 family)